MGEVNVVVAEVEAGEPEVAFFRIVGISTISGETDLSFHSTSFR